MMTSYNEMNMENLEFLNQEIKRYETLAAYLQQSRTKLLQDMWDSRTVR